MISGASGLGTASIQIAKALGATVLTTVSSPEKAELCRSLGADLVIDHTQEDFAEAVLQATGDVGADVVCDLAGGDFVGRSWTCVARGGRYLPVGFTDDDQNGMTGRPLRMASIGNFSIVGVLGAFVDQIDPGMRRFGFNPYTREEGDRVHAALLDLLASGGITPYVGRVVGLDEAAAALDDHLQRRSLGRTVVRIG
ncbi:MAG: zinc-binding alcohol dehydrogenase family protein [Marmoricola sp.]